MNRHCIVLIAVASVVRSVSGAGAAEITLIAPGGIRAAIEQMIPAFEQKTGHKVQATFGSGGGTKARVVKGDPFDVPVVQPPLPEVIASGHVVGASETPLANVAVGVAVPPARQSPTSRPPMR
jgi:molybdate transport system substrate-binding protein